VKFSYNWLAELVEGIDSDPRELSRLITMKTAESEGVEAYAPWLTEVRAARIVSAEPIPNSKNLKAVIDVGNSVHRTVVCGAPNCRPGLVTAYVPAGTVLAGREIRRATIAGVESDGMLASGAEIGLNRDAAGILELNHLQSGTALGVRPDYIIEIDNKSLTHRPDLWGHHGMAREVAAITHCTLRDPVDMSLVPEGVSPVQVRIEDHALCSRYSALAFENVTVQPSPLWLQYRLEAIGLNPINNIVDVTNFVMAELAQPMHAFDADKLQGDTIFVRRARDGEVCEALNGEAYALTANNLVIADSAGPVAIAGVIGGAWSAISESTTRIVFESANFNASSVRKISAALKLRTDASMRFEKAQDPVNTTRGLARAIELLQIVSPGIRIAGGLADAKGTFPGVPPIQLPLGWLNRKLGRAIAAHEVRAILESLEFSVDENAAGVLTVSVPSWRATKDISIKDDLVEEVGRMIGYDSITPQSPTVAVTVPERGEEQEYYDQVRRLTAAQGYTEVYNYSFLSDDAAREFGFDPESHVRVLNPIATDQALMRVSLVPGLVRNVRDNSRFFETFRLFEIGYEIHRQAAGLPREAPHLGAAVFAKEGGGQFFELKRLAESLAPGLEAKPARARAFEHPARTADLLLAGEVVGRVFELFPTMLEHGRAALLDMDLDALNRVPAKERRFQPIRRFPSSAFDLSVVVNSRELVATIENQLGAVSGEGLDRIEFVREYQGPPLPEGKKSVSFRLTVSSPDHTLSSDEVAQFRSRLIQAMREAGYDLRV
jgi:phenylalanyl-tRNA synthetase beta chain